MIRPRTIILLRLLMGWLFLWAFLDKLLGLGFATCRDATSGAVSYLCADAWLKGGSPTTGFLANAVRGPFADFFHTLVGNPTVDWLFMIGLAAVGLTLLFRVLVQLCRYAAPL